jgi:predicted DNA-binding antitoxin AbrB/MazE fold protein
MISFSVKIHLKEGEIKKIKIRFFKNPSRP